jgi:DNA polymerase
MNKITEIIDDTITTLEEMKRNGVTHVEVSAATLAELGKKPMTAARPTTTTTNDRRLAEPPLHQTAAATGGWVELETMALACTKCRELARTRTQVVFGVGNRQAEIMFIGEAPGADEDEQGEPFVGRAGQLLTKIIEAMGLTREEVYIANILKCRPPNNRPPLPDEAANCLPYLLRQIELVRPQAIVALGATAVRGLLGVESSISKVRGNWYLFHEVPLMPTFHPAYLLRNPSAKREVWQDMQAVLTKLGKPIPPVKKSV